MIMYAYNTILKKQVKAGSYNSKSKVFKKTVYTSNKLFVLNAYGIEKSIIDDLRIKGCKIIQLKEKDTQKTYEIDFDQFFKKAILRVFGNSTEQYYLPLRYYTCKNKKDAV